MARRQLEQLYGPAFRGPPTFVMSARGVTNPFIGITTIVSGAASVVVSTSLVTSDCFIDVQPYSPTDAASGGGRALEVKSIVDGVSFIIGTADGQVARNAATPVKWRLTPIK